MSLKDFHDAIQKVSLDSRNNEEKWFVENPPIKEFTITRDEEEVIYGVWDSGENWMVMFKLPNGKYNFKYKIILEKELVKSLNSM